MARIRAIKPGFFSNEDLADLDAYTRLFWIGMWTHSDRNGVIEYRPRRLKAIIFPYNEEITGTTAAEMTAELHDNGFVTVFQKDGAIWIHHTEWSKHQKPHHTEKHFGNPLPPDSYGEDGYDTVVFPWGHGSKTRRVKGLGLRVEEVSSQDPPLELRDAQEKAVSESLDVARKSQDTDGN